MLNPFGSQIKILDACAQGACDTVAGKDFVAIIDNSVLEESLVNEAQADFRKTLRECFAEKKPTFPLSVIHFGLVLTESDDLNRPEPIPVIYVCGNDVLDIDDPDGGHASSPKYFPAKPYFDNALIDHIASSGECLRFCEENDFEDVDFMMLAAMAYMALSALVKDFDIYRCHLAPEAVVTVAWDDEEVVFKIASFDDDAVIPAVRCCGF